MLGIVKEIDGQKKIVPLTTDTGTGAPVGTLITQYKKKPMSGYLYCDGSTFDENAYPALYMYLGTNVLPDYSNNVENGYVYIKATSGLAENQQENVLNDVKDFAFDKSKIRIGETNQGGSANNANWIATFDTPFPDNNYYVIATPMSASGAVNCPTGWYVSDKTATGFRIFCNGNAPLYVFEYIAIHN